MGMSVEEVRNTLVNKPHKTFERNGRIVSEPINQVNEGPTNYPNIQRVYDNTQEGYQAFLDKGEELRGMAAECFSKARRLNLSMRTKTANINVGHAFKLAEQLEQAAQAVQQQIIEISEMQQGQG